MSRSFKVQYFRVKNKDLFIVESNEKSMKFQKYMQNQKIAKNFILSTYFEKIFQIRGK